MSGFAAVLGTLTERLRRVGRAPADRPREGNVAALAAALHPREQALVVTQASPWPNGTVAYRLEPADPKSRVAPFRAGQYLAVRFALDASRTSRPYSICCSPRESREGNFYAVAVRGDAGGAAGPGIVERWAPGTAVSTSDPAGTFFYEPLRDAPSLVLLAGGTGITPFRSLVPDLLDRPDGPDLVLVHGFNAPSDALFAEDFRRWAQARPDRFRYVPLAAEGGPGWEGRTGFVSEGLLREIGVGSGDRSLFVCGPPGMHAHLDAVLEPFALPARRIRRESFSPAGRPVGSGALGIDVMVDGRERRVPADPGESILTALERAGLEAPSGCRTGECGWCRCRLVSGDVAPLSDVPGLREADADYGFIHPCSAKPLTDIRIELVPRRDSW